MFGLIVANHIHLRILIGKKHPQIKTAALTKIMNMDVWVVITSNQIFMRGFYTETKFS